ncbi:MAG: FYDLN acid domain-containing protein [Hyphomicrobiaceae bacterium]
MSNKAARGDKRKCQNEDCEASFYDLMREEFDCPICGTTFNHEAHASALAQQQAAVPDYIRRKQPRDLPIVASEAGSDEGANDKADEEGVEGEGGDGETVAEDETAIAAAADVLLEEDEDTSDPLADAVPLSVAENEDQ